MCVQQGNRLHTVLFNMLVGGSYICRNVIEFGDEGMFNDVNSNFRDDDHNDIGDQRPHVVWGKKITLDVNYF